MKFNAAFRRLVDAALVLWRVLPGILLVWTIAALAVRLLVKDRVPILSVLFYMTPLIVSAALSGCAAVIWLSRRSWRLSGIAGALAVMFVVWWHASTHVNHPVVPQDPAGDRVAFWNAGRGPRGWHGMTDTIEGFQADLIGLVEAGPRRGGREQLWRDRFPDYQIAGPRKGLILLSRGPILEHSLGRLERGGKYGLYRVSLKGRELEVLLVDIKSDPLRSRREAFESLMSLLDRLAGRPLIVMGDFNTPVDSAFVAPLAERLTNAFQARGNGYYVTWPLPLPVLSLDQIWAGPPITFQSCELGWTWQSDHRPVLATLAK